MKQKTRLRMASDWLKSDENRSAPDAKILMTLTCLWDDVLDKWVATGKLGGVVYKETADVRRAAIDKVLDRFGL